MRTAPGGEGIRLAGIGRPDPHRPNAGYVIGKETFAWARGSGRDAPIPVIRSTVGSGFWAELSSWTSAEFEQVPDEHEELPFGRVPGTVTLSSRVLREDSTARRQAANVAVARLEFNLSGEPGHQLGVRWIVPPDLMGARGNATKATTLLLPVSPTGAAGDCSGKPA